jgi:hypothetical protein
MSRSLVIWLVAKGQWRWVCDNVAQPRIKSTLEITRCTNPDLVQQSAMQRYKTYLSRPVLYRYISLPQHQNRTIRQVMCFGSFQNFLYQPVWLSALHKLNRYPELVLVLVETLLLSGTGDAVEVEKPRNWSKPRMKACMNCSSTAEILLWVSSG